MTDSGPPDEMVREALRRALDELLPSLLEERLPASSTNGAHSPAADEGHLHGNAAASEAPTIYPPPPVAAVHRPSGWHEPAASSPAPVATPRAAVTPSGSATEEVSLRSDAELDAFVRRLLHLFENPRDRLAIRSGRLRFVLAVRAAAASSPARRIERGAVTEKIVNEAAAAGERLVLAARAVLTPMARDRARHLGVEITREPRC